MRVTQEFDETDGDDYDLMEQDDEYGSEEGEYEMDEDDFDPDYTSSDGNGEITEKYRSLNPDELAFLKAESRTYCYHPPLTLSEELISSEDRDDDEVGDSGS